MLRWPCRPRVRTILPTPRPGDPEPGRCKVITRAGNRCRLAASDGNQFCAIHQKNPPVRLA